MAECREHPDLADLVAAITDLNLAAELLMTKRLLDGGHVVPNNRDSTAMHER